VPAGLARRRQMIAPYEEELLLDQPLAGARAPAAAARHHADEVRLAGPGPVERPRQRADQRRTPAGRQVETRPGDEGAVAAVDHVAEDRRAHAARLLARHAVEVGEELAEPARHPARLPEPLVHERERARQGRRAGARPADDLRHTALDDHVARVDRARGDRQVGERAPAREPAEAGGDLTARHAEDDALPSPAGAAAVL